MQDRGAESAERSISGMEAIIIKDGKMLSPEPAQENLGYMAARVLQSRADAAQSVER